MFSEKLEGYLREMLGMIPVHESVVLLNHFPFFMNDIPRHSLTRGKALQKVLEDHPRVRLYLHGHTHRHTIADLQVSGLPLILDSGSCTYGKKGAWNLIDLNDQGCTVTTYRWNGEWTPTRTDPFVWQR